MAKMFMMAQVEVGHGCSISMTGAVLPALRDQPSLAAIWEPRIRTNSYDYRMINPAEKSGCLLGMGLTERQGERPSSKLVKLLHLRLRKGRTVII